MSQRNCCHFPNPCAMTNLFEVDVDEITARVESLLQAVSDRDEIRMCVQMHGFVLCGEDGSAVTRYISWRDRRSSLISKELRYPFELPKTRGVGYKDNLPLASLYMMRSVMPEIIRNAKTFCSLGSYLTWRFAGGNISHITDLAPTGLYDARSGRLCSDRMTEVLSFPCATLAQSPVGKYKGALWYAPIGDQQASVAGSGIRKGQALLNIGTAAQMCMISDEEIYGNYESRPYFGGKTLCTVTGLIGGRDYAYWSEHNGAKHLADNYGDAMRRLPNFDSIRVIGGVCTYYRPMFEEMLALLGKPWEICHERDALDGLIHAMGEQ